MAGERRAVPIKRAYDAAAPEDGTRVLVERLWPRGLSKAEAHVDVWLREVAPSTELRRWYGHDPEKWEEFQRRYRAELEGEAQRGGLARLRELAGAGPVTLVIAARDVEHSNAVVLRDLLAAAGR
jgi:uncharacterized protein YeaO (DUF488 family)